MYLCHWGQVSGRARSHLLFCTHRTYAHCHQSRRPSVGDLDRNNTREGGMVLRKCIDVLECAEAGKEHWWRGEGEKRDIEEGGMARKGTLKKAGRRGRDTEEGRKAEKGTLRRRARWEMGFWGRWEGNKRNNEKDGKAIKRIIEEGRKVGKEHWGRWKGWYGILERVGRRESQLGGWLLVRQTENFWQVWRANCGAIRRVGRGRESYSRQQD